MITLVLNIAKPYRKKNLKSVLTTLINNHFSTKLLTEISMNKKL